VSDTKKLAGADAVARRDAIVEAFRPLVVLIAKHVASQYGGITTTDDLEQAGYLGLIDAAAGFGHYARARIEGAMRDSIRKRDWREAGHPRHEDVAPLPDPVGNLDQFVLLSELYAAIHEELSPREAQIVQLQLDGHSGTEIAATLGIRQQTVVVHQRRAAVKLREKMVA
jgi:RNA polymerase sigma factor (sigma-70 family)